LRTNIFVLNPIKIKKNLKNKNKNMNNTPERLENPIQENEVVNSSDKAKESINTELLEIMGIEDNSEITRQYVSIRNTAIE
jgi:hypothetical protein